MMGKYFLNIREAREDETIENNNGSSVLQITSDQLFAYYNFKKQTDESTILATDYSGHGNHATLNNIKSTDWTQQGLKLGGNNQRITPPFTTSAFPENFSIQSVSEVDSASTDQQVIGLSANNCSPPTGIFFYRKSGNHIYFGRPCMDIDIWGNEGNVTSLQHFGMTVNGSTWKIYRNGVPIQTINNGSGVNGNVPLYIGYSTGMPYFKGVMGAVAFHGKALSDTEILNDYTCFVENGNLGVI